MAIINKMDEIMELLTEEIGGFNQNIKKLESLSQDIKEITIPADASNIESMLKKFLEDRQEKEAAQELHLAQIETKIKAAVIIPKWLMALFFLLAAITVITFGY